MRNALRGLGIAAEVLPGVDEEEEAVSKLLLLGAAVPTWYLLPLQLALPVSRLPESKRARLVLLVRLMPLAAAGASGTAPQKGLRRAAGAGGARGTSGDGRGQTSSATAAAPGPTVEAVMTAQAEQERLENAMMANVLRRLEEREKEIATEQRRPIMTQPSPSLKLTNWSILPTWAPVGS
ncbi:unnamed protein product [Tilletia caries]|nr:hypothetical protein CF335_g8574 [Tilletia laevis]CAD7065970.1 unnamed protein product [Tilletia caries]